MEQEPFRSLLFLGVGFCGKIFADFIIVLITVLNFIFILHINYFITKIQDYSEIGAMISLFFGFFIGPNFYTVPLVLP